MVGILVFMRVKWKNVLFIYFVVLILYIKRVWLILLFFGWFLFFSRKCFQETSLQASFEFLFVEAVYKAFPDPY